MTKEVLAQAEKKMKGAVEGARREFAAVRTGRANPALLERVMVDYYGTPTPLPQLAGITAPEARVLLIQPWDRNALKEIERAILKSDLGLTPTNDGQVIRLVLPPLTEERRRELVKLVKKEAEERRVTIRNIRREANEELKKAEKEGKISEDELRRVQEEVQKLTDRYIGEIDHLVEAKEKEIMEV